QNLDAALFKFRLELGRIAQFGGAYGGEILRMAEQHRPAPVDEVVEMNGAFGGFEGEIGGDIADQNRHDIKFPVAPLPATGSSPEYCAPGAAFKWCKPERFYVLPGFGAIPFPCSCFARKALRAAPARHCARAPARH